MLHPGTLVPLLLGLTLCACSGKDDGTTEDPGTESEATTDDGGGSGDGGEGDGSGSGGDDGGDDAGDDGGDDGGGDGGGDIIWALEPGLQTLTIDEEIDGVVVTREIIVHVPPDATGPLPALFAFHGAGGRSDQWVGAFGALVDAGSFIGVYPNGHEGFWALGPEPSNADDIAFVETIITRLPLGDMIDGDRLYALGYSNGAGMVHRLGIETDHFRAFAAMASALTIDPQPAAGAHTESVLQIHGMADETCPYEGGDSVVEHVFEHSEASAAIWADAIGCTGAPTEEVTADGDIWLSWTDCPDGRAVQHVGLAGVGHDIPPDFMGGLMPWAWSFLEAH